MRPSEFDRNFTFVRFILVRPVLGETLPLQDLSEGRPCLYRICLMGEESFIA